MPAPISDFLEHKARLETPTWEREGMSPSEAAHAMVEHSLNATLTDYITTELSNTLQHAELILSFFNDEYFSENGPMTRVSSGQLIHAAKAQKFQLQAVSANRMLKLRFDSHLYNVNLPTSWTAEEFLSHAKRIEREQHANIAISISQSRQFGFKSHPHDISNIADKMQNKALKIALSMSESIERIILSPRNGPGFLPFENDNVNDLAKQFLWTASVNHITQSVLISFADKHDTTILLNLKPLYTDHKALDMLEQVLKYEFTVNYKEFRNSSPEIQALRDRIASTPVPTGLDYPSFELPTNEKPVVDSSKPPASTIVQFKPR